MDDRRKFDRLLRDHAVSKNGGIFNFSGCPNDRKTVQATAYNRDDINDSLYDLDENLRPHISEFSKKNNSYEINEFITQAFRVYNSRIDESKLYDHYNTEVNITNLNMPIEHGFAIFCLYVKAVNEFMITQI